MDKSLNWNWVRCTSIGICLVFVYVHVVFSAIEPAKSFWEQRKESAQKLRRGNVPLREGNVTLLAKLPEVDLNLLPQSIPIPQSLGREFKMEEHKISVPNLPITSKYSIIPSWVQSLSGKNVSIKDLYLPPSWKPGDFMVVHIQDAHGNVEAQKNIAKAIEFLSQGQNKTPSPNLGEGQGEDPHLIVGIEGARGAFNFAAYRAFSDNDITKQIADYFLQGSFITGPEYAGMTSEQPLEFWGVEDESHYLSHVQAYKDSVAFQKEARAMIELLMQQLEQTKTKSLNPELCRLDNQITLHRKGKTGLGEHLKMLDQINFGRDSGPAIKQFLNAYQIEASLDFKKVESERTSLTRALAENLPKQELQNLVKASLSYRLGNLAHGAFYQYMKDLCIAYGIKLSAWPEMDKYIRYVLLSDKISAEQLLAEVGDVEKKEVEGLIKTDKEREVIRLSRYLTLIEKLVNFQLSPAEWKEYEMLGHPASADFANVIKFIQPFERFNRAAIARNDVLVGNLLQKSGGRLAVLVAGGFHTDGMMGILKNKKIAYAVLTPRLGKAEGTGSEYLDVFKRDETPIEKLFTGERITLASQSRMAPGMGETMPDTLTVESQFIGFQILLKLAKTLKAEGYKTPSERRAAVDQIAEKVRAQVLGEDGVKFLTVRDIETSSQDDRSIAVHYTYELNGVKKQSTVDFALLEKEAPLENVSGIPADVGPNKILMTPHMPAVRWGSQLTTLRSSGAIGFLMSLSVMDILSPHGIAIGAGLGLGMIFWLWLSDLLSRRKNPSANHLIVQPVVREPGTLPKVAIVIVNFKGGADPRGTVHIKNLLASLGAMTREKFNYEVIVVDNDSTPDSLGAIREGLADFPVSEVIENPANLGAAAARNQAIRNALGRGNDYIMTFDNDTFIEPGVVDQMVDFAEKSPQDVLAITPRIYNAKDKDKLWSVGRKLAKFPYLRLDARGSQEDKFTEPSEVDFLTTAAALFRASAFKEDHAGLFNEDFFIYEEDSEWCVRAQKAGGRTLFVPVADKVYHVGNQSFNGGRISSERNYYMIRNRLLSMRIHGQFLQPLHLLRLFRALAIMSYKTLIQGKSLRAFGAFLLGIWDGSLGRGGIGRTFQNQASNQNPRAAKVSWGKRYEKVLFPSNNTASQNVPSLRDKIIQRIASNVPLLMSLPINFIMIAIVGTSATQLSGLFLSEGHFWLAVFIWGYSISIILLIWIWSFRVVYSILGFLIEKFMHFDSKHLAYTKPNLPQNAIYPSLTAIIPVYDEPWEAILTSLNSAISAREHFEHASNIVVADDYIGVLAGGDVAEFVRSAKSKAIQNVPLSGAETEVLRRLNFYDSHGIGVIAQPAHQAHFAEGTYIREGQFPKAHNLNVLHQASDLIEDYMKGGMTYSEALKRLIKNGQVHGFTTFKYAYISEVQSICTGDVLLFLDNDSFVPQAAHSPTLAQFVLEENLAYTQNETVIHNGDQSLFARLLASNVDANRFLNGFKARFGIVTFSGHNGYIRKSVLRQVGYWPVDRISEDHVVTYRIINERDPVGNQYYGKFIAYPGLEFGESAPEDFTTFAGREYKFIMGDLQTFLNPIANWMREGIFSRDTRSYLSSHLTLTQRHDNLFRQSRPLLSILNFVTLINFLIFPIIVPESLLSIVQNGATISVVSNPVNLRIVPYSVFTIIFLSILLIDLIPICVSLIRTSVTLKNDLKEEEEIFYWTRIIFTALIADTLIMKMIVHIATLPWQLKGIATHLLSREIKIGSTKNLTGDWKAQAVKILRANKLNIPFSIFIGILFTLWLRHVFPLIQTTNLLTRVILFVFIFEHSIRVVGPLLGPFVLNPSSGKKAIHLMNDVKEFSRNKFNLEARPRRLSLYFIGTAAVAGGILLRFWNLNYLGPWMDEAMYILAGKNMGNPALNYGWISGWKYLYPAVTYFGYDLAGSVVGSRIVNGLLGLGTAFFAFLFSRKVISEIFSADNAKTNDARALASLVVLMASGPLMIISRLATYDGLAFFFFAVSVYLIQNNSKSKNPSAFLFLGAIAFVLAFLSKYFLVIFTPFILTYALIQTKDRTRWTKYFLLPFLFPLAVFFAFFGNDFAAGLQYAAKQNKLQSWGVWGITRETAINGGVPFLLSILGLLRVPKEKRMLAFWPIGGAMLVYVYHVLDLHVQGLPKVLSGSVILLAPLAGVGLIKLMSLAIHRRKQVNWLARLSILAILIRASIWTLPGHPIAGSRTEFWQDNYTVAEVIKYYAQDVPEPWIHSSRAHELALLLPSLESSINPVKKTGVESNPYFSSMYVTPEPEFFENIKNRKYAIVHLYPEYWNPAWSEYPDLVRNTLELLKQNGYVHAYYDDRPNITSFGTELSPSRSHIYVRDDIFNKSGTVTSKDGHLLFPGKSPGAMGMWQKFGINNLVKIAHLENIILGILAMGATVFLIHLGLMPQAPPANFADAGLLLFKIFSVSGFLYIFLRHLLLKAHYYLGVAQPIGPPVMRDWEEAVQSTRTASLSLVSVPFIVAGMIFMSWAGPLAILTGIALSGMGVSLGGRLHARRNDLAQSWAMPRSLIEIRMERAFSEIKKFQIDDHNAQVRHALKLVALWRLFNGEALDQTLSADRIDQTELERVIRFHSTREMASIAGHMDAVAKGVSAWDFFYHGGMQEDLSADALIFEEAINAYQIMRYHARPGLRLSETQIASAKDIWELGRISASALKTCEVIDVLNSEKLKRTDAYASENQVLLHKVHRLSNQEISILVRSIKRENASGNLNQVTFLLDAGTRNISRSELKQLLGKYGVTENMFDGAFRGDFKSHMITEEEIAQRQNVDPSIKRDTEMIYEIAAGKAGVLAGRPIRGKISLDIYTDEMIYSESWGEKLSIRILFIVSQTQVVVMSQCIDQALREDALVALQQ